MRQAALLVAVVCLLSAPLASAAGSGGTAQASVQEESLTKEGVHIAVELQADGDARWNVSARYELDSENDSAAFDELVESFKNYETDNGFSVGVFRSVAPRVSERVGRDMQIVNDRRTATRIDHGNNSTGVLSVQFTWTNFSQVNERTLVVDSFSGSWFGNLESDQTLTIQPPDGYSTDTVEPTTSVVNGAYRWEGPQHFADSEPRLVFNGSPGVAGGNIPLLAVFGLVGLLLAGGVLAWAYSRGKLPDIEVPEGIQDVGGGGGSDADGGDAVADSTNGGTDADRAAAASTGGGAAAGGGATAGGSTATTAEDSDRDTDLLSDEERVERLLENNGGRMKQSKIVEETRWSTAKVSQLLSAMDDDGRIEKLRIGRENLISLPGEGVNDE